MFSHLVKIWEVTQAENVSHWIRINILQTSEMKQFLPVALGQVTAAKILRYKQQ